MSSITNRLNEINELLTRNKSLISSSIISKGGDPTLSSNSTFQELSEGILNLKSSGENIEILPIDLFSLDKSSTSEDILQIYSLDNWNKLFTSQGLLYIISDSVFTPVTIIINDTSIIFIIDIPIGGHDDQNLAIEFNLVKSEDNQITNVSVSNKYVFLEQSSYDVNQINNTIPQPIIEFKLKDSDGSIHTINCSEDYQIKNLSSTIDLYDLIGKTSDEILNKLLENKYYQVILSKCKSENDDFNENEYLYSADSLYLLLTYFCNPDQIGLSPLYKNTYLYNGQVINILNTNIDKEDNLNNITLSYIYEDKMNKVKFSFDTSDISNGNILIQCTLEQKEIGGSLTGNITTHTHDREVQIITKSPDVWDGVSESLSLDGSGTQSDPYLINTCSDYLHWFKNSSKYNGDADSPQIVYIKITNDLDFNNIELNLDQYSYTSVLSSNPSDPTSVNGISVLVNLDGGNHEIKNINVLNSGSITPLGYICSLYNLKFYGNITINLDTSTYYQEDQDYALMNLSGGFPDMTMMGYSTNSGCEYHLNISMVGTPKGSVTMAFVGGNGTGGNLYDNVYTNNIEYGSYSVTMFERIMIVKSSNRYSSYTKSKFYGSLPSNIDKNLDPFNITEPGNYSFSYLIDRLGISSGEVSSDLYYDSSITNKIIVFEQSNQDNQIVDSTDNIIPKSDSELKSDEFLNTLISNSYNLTWVKGDDSYPCFYKEAEYEEIELYPGYVSNNGFKEKVSQVLPYSSQDNDGIITSNQYIDLFGGDRYENIDKWDGTVAIGFNGGTGTSSDPYTIVNGQQLAYLAKIVNEGYDTSGKYYSITKDIDLNNIPFTPIGGCATKEEMENGTWINKGIFKGTLRSLSGSKITPTIYNLSIIQPDKYCVGLFGISFGETGYLIINNGNIEAAGLCGSFIGLSMPSNDLGILLYSGCNITVNGSELSSSCEFSNSSGGLIGSYVYTNYDTNCTPLYYGFSGFCGKLISNTSYSRSYFGGIIGEVIYSVNVNDDTTVKDKLSLNTALTYSTGEFDLQNSSSYGINIGHIVLKNSGSLDVSSTNIYEVCAVIKSGYELKYKDPTDSQEIPEFTNQNDLLNILSEFDSTFDSETRIVQDKLNGYPAIYNYPKGYMYFYPGVLSKVDDINKIYESSNIIDGSHPNHYIESSQGLSVRIDNPVDGMIYNLMISNISSSSISIDFYSGQWICDDTLPVSIESGKYLEANVWYVKSKYFLSYKLWK